MSLLSIRDLRGGYGPVQVLFGVELDVAEGEVVALVGRNGMGKTTTIRMLTGALAPAEGEIAFAKTPITRLADFRIARLGIGLVPEGRQIFPNLSVEEHLILAASRAPGEASWGAERIYALFPRLKERRKQLARTMSGGEQQMLAIGRALITNPRLLVLDEATEGLAPLVRREIWACLETVARSGVSVLVVDKNIQALNRIAHRMVVISKGRTVWAGSSQAFAEAKQMHATHLGV